MSQATFWLSQPHRAMSTFREPVIFVTFFLPLVLIYLKHDDKKNYLISGSPKCPLTGLKGGEIGHGINPLSFEKQSFSIAQ